MNCKWPELTIDELKAPHKGSIAMGPFGSRIKAENFVNSGIPVLKGGNLHGAYIDDSVCDYLTKEKADELKSSNAFEGDIVITHRGTIGQVSIIPKGAKHDRYVVSQSQLKISLDKEKVNPYYVNYFLRSHIGQHRLLSYASQVGVPAIAQASTSVKKIQVPCPPLNIQNKIVSFLQSLDHKITLNNQTNQTLEEMAQAIFKSWFVDFEPVKAKMRGEQPEGMDADTAALFPDKLVESELGLIPEGWEVKPFKRVIDKYIDNRGKTPPLSNEGIPLIEVKHIPANSNFPIFNTDKKFTEETYNTWFRAHVEPKDILISTVGTIGRTSIVKDTRFGIAQNVLGLRFGEVTTPEYMFFTIKAHRFQHDMDARLVTTVQSSIKRKDLNTIDILTPPVAIQQKFSELAAGFLDTQFSKAQENIALEKLRDTLLPKLLSGEIDLDLTNAELIDES